MANFLLENASKLFGFQIKKDKDDVADLPAIVPAITDDGAVIVASGGVYGTYVDLDGTVRSEGELINKYREMSENPVIDAAVEDITNESIVLDENKEIVDIILEKVIVPDKIKSILMDEFETVKQLYEFNNQAYEIFKRWYVDGRMYFQIIVDPKHMDLGIQEIRYIDPRKIRKIKEIKVTKDSMTSAPLIQVVQEYYLFNDKGFSTQGASISTSAQPGLSVGIKIAKDSIIHITSGIASAKGDIILSYLHKAIKPLNQLSSLEDSLVIYRISRAPERRIFYIDIGNLPKMKAEQYLRDTMTRFKNKVVYDANSGEIRDDRKFMCYTLDTKIPLLDGRTLELQDIISEYKTGKINWVYSCNPQTGKFVPGPISWAGITKENSEVVQVTLDNGKTLTCTPDHKFPVWNKGFIEAQNLAEGESIIPGYRRYKSIQTNGIEYEQIYKNDTKTWEFTHREIIKWKAELNLNEEFVFSSTYKDSSKTIIHHKDFNRFNNSPDNLVKMNHKDHMMFHHDIQNIEYTDEIIFKVNECAKLLLSINDTIEVINSSISINTWKQLNVEKNPKNRDMINLVFTYKDLLRICKAKGHGSWRNYRNNYDLRPREANGRIRRASSLKFSAEHKEKLSLAAKNRNHLSTKSWKIITPTGDIEIIDNLNEFCRKNGLNRSNIKYNHSKGYTAEVLHNHKVVSVKFLTEKMTVGALTIDQNETYHSHHTYLLDAGIYTKNTMLEDFWLPRREGGRGTEITTLPGGQNLGQIDDIIFFQRKLFRSLSVPITRLDPEAMFNYGRANEITRDEVKFSKFIDRLRTRFASLFTKTLRTQLILKNIMKPEEFDAISHLIKYKFASDTYFEESKTAEVTQDRMNVLEQVVPFVGRYYSNRWVRKNLLGQTDVQMAEEDAEIAAEASNPQYSTPIDAEGQAMGDFMPHPMGGNMTQIPPDMGVEVQKQKLVNQGNIAAAKAKPKPAAPKPKAKK